MHRSTTLDRNVAMGYASGSNAAGIVFEIVQGMVDRGANIGWLSACLGFASLPSP